MSPMNVAKKMLLLFNGGAAPAFSPTDISGLALWLDASDSATLFQNSDGTTASAVGDPVGYIADKSGGGNHATQSTAGARPTRNTADFGVSALSFDGGDTLTSAYNPGKSDITVIMVCRVTGLTTQVILAQTYMACGPIASVPSCFMLAPASTQRNAALADTPTSKSILIFNPDRDAGWKNGAPLVYTNAAAAFGSGVDATTRIGARSGSLYMTGYVGELIVYDSILTSGQRILVENYLASKWGIALEGL